MLKTNRYTTGWFHSTLDQTNPQVGYYRGTRPTVTCSHIIGISASYVEFFFYSLTALWTLQGQKCVQTDVLSGKHKIKYAVLIRLLTQTTKAPKKRNLLVQHKSGLKTFKSLIRIQDFGLDLVSAVDIYNSEWIQNLFSFHYFFILW